MSIVELNIFAFHSSCILIGQVKRKPSETCQKVVQKFIKTFVELQR